MGFPKDQSVAIQPTCAMALLFSHFIGQMCMGVCGCGIE